MPAARKTRELNLLPKENLGDTVSGQILSFALSYGRYIIILTQIAVLSVFFMRFKLDRDHNDYKELVSQRQSIVQSMSEIEKEVRRVQAKLVYIKKITLHQTLYENILTFLSTSIPSEVRFYTLSLEGTELAKITIKGTAPSLTIFNSFLQIIQTDDKFKDLTIESLTRKSDNSLEFEVKASINTPVFF
ncbi:hypothetical protein A3D77_03765 [Candidatus Gottesmanbacteria bacterium RIFCSPHIGHO2_02_FULL_39_11]|uniref:PilN domain-containing protein n=1 Tax=Candidatus Gottesmanbacteria bacterium RIFCSPHIGHO2_02_FULL_39_11 TaxID=1798382 RepID=A0A1F5ZX09_9BACT|nr:MAG: hypothetical protein A3D77_03765 [Candidatus Gottesmanbacteria bacterium RIFCSPHIGHO2_02_FULL_39_11]